MPPVGGAAASGSTAASPWRVSATLHSIGPQNAKSGASIGSTGQQGRLRLCSRCAKNKAAGRDGLCGGCRLAQVMLRRESAGDGPKCRNCGERQPIGDTGLCRLCAWGMDNGKHSRYLPLDARVLEELRLAYKGNVQEVARNLTRLSNRTGIPKRVLKMVANRRGWWVKRPPRWTPEELTYLEENLGQRSAALVAKKLGRSVSAVESAARARGLSTRVLEGYNISTLAEVFGVTHQTVESWMRRGLLGCPHGKGGHGSPVRFSENNVVNFIRCHCREYDLARVDQIWFRAMVFGSLAGLEG